MIAERYVVPLANVLGIEVAMVRKLLAGDRDAAVREHIEKTRTRPAHNSNAGSAA